MCYLKLCACLYSHLLIVYVCVRLCVRYVCVCVCERVCESVCVYTHHVLILLRHVGASLWSYNLKQAPILFGNMFFKETFLNKYLNIVTENKCH